jgi:hypothetical protein
MVSALAQALGAFIIPIDVAIWGYDITIWRIHNP